MAITSRKVNHILDADVRDFFGSVNHDWLVRFLEHRIGDKRIIRLIRKWLKAGILEDGVVTVADRGTGQGSVISPLLANIYLHYVFDLWAERWRRQEARGDMIVVRYADDLVAGFEHEDDARRFLDAMRERFEAFSLSLHPDKTRLIEFGRHAAADRKKRGVGRPETFAFLGFTFICGKSRRGAFQLQRKTRRDRMRAKLQEIKAELRRRMHQTIPDQGHWLRQVVTGHFAYYAVPTNSRALSAFRHYVADLWRRTLRRRSQKDGFTWDRMTKLADDWLPAAAYPSSLARPALRRQTPEVRAGCSNWARPDLCGGCPAMGIPTAIRGRAVAPFRLATWASVSDRRQKGVVGECELPDPQRTSERPREYLEPMLTDTHKYCYVRGMGVAMRRRVGATTRISEPMLTDIHKYCYVRGVAMRRREFSAKSRNELTIF